MEVTFSEAFQWDPARHAVLFHAFVGNRRQIACFVSAETFRDRFGALAVDSASCLDAFRSDRSRLEQLAGELIRGGRLKSDGTVLVQARNP